MPVERAAADEDVVLLDVEGVLDGERLEEYSATALSYEVGSSGMVSGADEAIRGLSEGESAKFTFTPKKADSPARRSSSPSTSRAFASGHCQMPMTSSRSSPASSTPSTS